MKRPVVVGAVVAVTSLVGAIVTLVVADRLLDDRKNMLLATKCKTVVDVPETAVALNYVGAALLVISTLSLAMLVVLLITGSSRLKAVSIPVTVIAFVMVGLYAVLVVAGSVAPGSNEKSSPHYHPCPSSF